MNRRGWTILVVSLVVVIVAGSSVYWFIFRFPPGASCGTDVQDPPLGGDSFTLGTPIETVTGGNHWYNFTIQSAGGGLEMNNLNFQVQSSGGSSLTPNATWKLNVEGLKGMTVASYSMTSGLWTSGSTVTVSSSMIISLDTPVTMSGNTFVLLLSGGGPCPLAGTVNTAIP